MEAGTGKQSRRRQKAAGVQCVVVLGLLVLVLVLLVPEGSWRAI